MFFESVWRVRNDYAMILSILSLPMPVKLPSAVPSAFGVASNPFRAAVVRIPAGPPPRTANVRLASRVAACYNATTPRRGQMPGEHSKWIRSVARRSLDVRERMACAGYR